MCVAVVPELGAIYQFLRVTDRHSQNVSPVGGPEQVEAAWRELDEAKVALAFLVAEPSAWGAHFTAGFRNMLTVAERLALPGERDRAIWTGGDSTLEVIGAADWSVIFIPEV